MLRSPPLLPLHHCRTLTHRAQNLVQLELLDVAHNDLTTLAGLEPLSRLHVLRAGHNRVARLPCMTALTRLTELSLSSCPLTSLQAAAAPCFVRACGAAGNAACGGSGGDDGDAMAGGGGGGPCQAHAPQACALPTSLRRLSLARCALPAAAACAPLRGLCALEGLALDGNDFTQAARQAPGESYRRAALAHCPLSLRTLDMEPVRSARLTLMHTVVSRPRGNEYIHQKHLCVRVHMLLGRVHAHTHPVCT